MTFLMRILAIESSCDETAMAVVLKQDGNFIVEKNLLATQIEMHKLYGGVVPEIAAREHVTAIFPMLLALNIDHEGNGIDAIAVTYGPGLVPALRIGVELAKTLAWVWQKPLVAVNHLEGHIYSVWSIEKSQISNPTFPALCLLVSGGHTELILMKDHGQYEMIGRTRDDAAGEAFDKVAQLLGLEYPGGPSIAKVAEGGNPNAIIFPRPMHDSGDFDFSFSGLKTAVRVYRDQHPECSVEDIAASFQQAVVDSLVDKTFAAVSQFHPRSVILSGGVSANQSLRSTLRDKLVDRFPDIAFHAPDLSLTGDNAVMIAIAGAQHVLKKDFVDPLTLEADPNLKLAKN